SGAASGAEHAGNETRLTRSAKRKLVSGGAGIAGAGAVEFIHELRHAIVGHRDRIRIEGIGFDDVCAGFQIGGVNAADDLRLRQSEQVVIALLVAAVFMKSIAVVMMGVQSMALDHGAHRAVEHEYSLGEKVVQKLNALVGHAFVEIKMKNPSAGSGTGLSRFSGIY